MFPNRHTGAQAGLLLALLLGPGSGRAVTPTIDWHYIGGGQPITAYSLSPLAPTFTDPITFVLPTDGLSYVNYCFASVENGRPQIAVNLSTYTITISFTSYSSACPLIAMPVSGLEAKVGPLPSGLWTINVPPYLPFHGPYWLNVSAVARPPSLQISLAEGAVLVSWPVTTAAFQLEWTADPGSGNWQPVDQTPTVFGDQNQVRVALDSGERFFRLKLHP